MLREQLFGFAINALTRAYETKEKIKKNLKSDFVQSYVQGLKQAAITLIEQRLYQHEANSENLRRTKSTTSKHATKSASSSAPVNTTRKYTIKKTRKSSIRQAREIRSTRADAILSKLGPEESRQKELLSLNAQRSLDCLIWALGQAARAELQNGISVHDVSALLYKAHGINLYPINISRVVHSNEMLVRQAGQAMRTKTYLLTDAGMRVFEEKFV